MIQRYDRFLLAFLSLLIAGFSVAIAQPAIPAGEAVWPPELYTGENVITVTMPAGIREIRTVQTANVRVEGAGMVDCRKQYPLKVYVSTASQTVVLDITIIDCNNRRIRRQLALPTTWQLDNNRYGAVEQMKTACRDFSVRATGAEPIYLDSISVDDPRLRLELPSKLPIRVFPNENFSYTVCFTADSTTGIFKFPVTTWIRRPYPSGGKTTYAVADSGVVRVVQRKIPPPPRVVPPPDTIQQMAPPIAEDTITDPTTFRSVAVPNAIIPPAGHFFVGDYDFLGLTAGYSLDDHLMVIAAGALPTPDDWGGLHQEIFGAYSIGLKVGMPLAEDLNIAAGYQWGRSVYDQVATPLLDSRITINAPYGAISYGDDDSRISATFGYAFKHHSKPDQKQEFDENATFFAVGGDARIAKHWKLAGEIVTVESLGVIPIVASARYFTNRYAIDFGVGYVGIATGDNAAPKIPLVPVLSAIFVF
ncbi:MAG: hypothetical protein ABIR47_09440 [Candidatus Kapaibacterium sp.]